MRHITMKDILVDELVLMSQELSKTVPIMNILTCPFSYKPPFPWSYRQPTLRLETTLLGPPGQESLPTVPSNDWRVICHNCDELNSFQSTKLSLSSTSTRPVTMNFGARAPQPSPPSSTLLILRCYVGFWGFVQRANMNFLALDFRSRLIVVYMTVVLHATKGTTNGLIYILSLLGGQQKSSGVPILGPT